MSDTRSVPSHMQDNDHDVVVCVRMKGFGNKAAIERLARETIPRLLSVEMHQPVATVAWAATVPHSGLVESRNGTAVVIELLDEEHKPYA